MSDAFELLLAMDLGDDLTSRPELHPGDVDPASTGRRTRCTDHRG